MRRTMLPRNLQVTLIGFEDETPEQKLAREAKEAEENDDDDEEEEDEGKGKKKEGEGQDTAGLKSALEKERKERKRLDKENKALAKFKEEAEGKDKSDTDKAKDDTAKAVAKAEKLATRLKKSEVDNIITKLATSLKFRDLDDALSLVNRDDIEVEQDDDDPSDVEVDEASVKKALETLAKKKPHLIAAEGQEDKSGSKFNGRQKSKTELDDEKLKELYPALNRSSHKSPTT